METALEATPAQAQVRDEILEIKRLAIHIKSYGVKNDLLTVHKEPVDSETLYYLSNYFEAKIEHPLKGSNVPTYIRIDDKQTRIYVELKKEPADEKRSSAETD